MDVGTKVEVELSPVYKLDSKSVREKVEKEFDAAFYLAVNSDLVSCGIDPIAHYDSVGWKKGLDPNPLFSTRHYLAANKDVAEAGINPFKHFLYTGRNEGRPWAPTIFDPKFYRRKYNDVPRDDGNAVAHYSRTGSIEARQPNPLFDVTYYRAQLSRPDDRRRNALENYLTVGWRDGLSPHPLFDPQFYQARMSPQEARSVCPLVHYLVIGWRLGLTPHPLFDPDYYSRFTHLATKEGCPLIHYLTESDGESTPHYLFSDGFYKTVAEHAFKSDPKKHYRDGPPLLHYIKFGAKQQVSTHPLFDVDYYRQQVKKWLSENDAKDTNEVLMKLDQSDLVRHYVEIGASLGLSPTPLFVPEFYRRQFECAIEGDPLRHYLLRENFSFASPHPAIDPEYYASHAHDFDRNSVPSVVHLMATDQDRRVSPHPLLDPCTYRLDYEDLANSTICPIMHFLTEGMRQGRNPNRWMSQPYMCNLFPSEPFFEKTAVEFYLSSKFEDRLLMIFCGHNASRTGAPLVLLRLVKHFSSLENVECLTILAEGGPLLDDYYRYSHVHVLRTRDRTFLEKTGPHALEFRKELEDLAERVGYRRKVLCICNSVETRHIANILANFGFPVVGMVHESAEPYLPQQMQDMYDACKLLVLVSNYVLETARRKCPVPLSKVIVRPPGLLTDRFGTSHRSAAKVRVRNELGIPKDARIVLGCGTVEWRKGTDLFVEVALAALGQSNEQSPAEIHFVWLGEGATTYDTTWFWAKQRIAEQKQERRIHFIGARTDAEPYFLAADLFLMTSRIDPLPTVVHEAMACALPVIAFEGKSGSPESFQESGIVVPFNSAKMAKAVLALLCNETRLKKLGARAREIIQSKYAFKDYAQDLQSVIHDRLKIDLSPSQKCAVRLKSQNKTVYFSAAHWGISGVHRFTEYLVHGLNAKGFDGKILFTHGRFVQPKKDRMLPSVPYQFIRPATSSPEDVWLELLVFFKEQRQDCIYVPNFDLVAAAACPLLPEHVGIVGIVHSDDAINYEHAHRLGLYWDRIVSVSQHIAYRVCEDNRSFTQKHSIIRHGVPFDKKAANEAVARREKKSVEDPLHIVYAGRFVRHQKRIFDYAKVAELLLQADVNFKMTLLGTGDDYDTFRAEIDELVEAKVIDVPGRSSLDEITTALTNADVFLLLSEFEGLPLSVLEAMSFGCIPVIWNIESGVREIISTGVNGFLLEKFDFSSLVKLLASLAGQRQKIAQMSRAVISSFEKQHLDAESMVERYASLFADVFASLERGQPLRNENSYKGILPPPWL
jgi:glycosyltransferase involved in cell wall biosynthesis